MCDAVNVSVLYLSKHIYVHIYPNGTNGPPIEGSDKILPITTESQKKEGIIRFS